MNIFLEEGRRRQLQTKIQTCLPIQVRDIMFLPRGQQGPRSIPIRKTGYSMYYLQIGHEPLPGPWPLKLSEQSLCSARGLMAKVLLTLQGFGGGFVAQNRLPRVHSEIGELH